ncbi:MAG: chromate resistance protein ChrB domain-containing protein [Syntrophobacteraceae bacterium]
MAESDSEKWLLLIHQIPPKPNALRVKIWRRLQHVGAVAVKQSVYAMPFSEQSREDLSWILKEIVEGGGDGSISEARFLEGLTDAQVIDLFRNARKSDYEKIIREGKQLLGNWPSREDSPPDPAARNRTHVYKLRQRLSEVSAIDFFQAPERETAETVLKELASRMSHQPPVACTATEGLDNLEGKTWVTRKNVFVDRIACGWLVRRFVDEKAAFRFVQSRQYVPEPDEVRFDMFEGEFTHEGDRCTFEVMLRHMRLPDPALARMAEVIHDIDLKDSRYNRAEAAGFRALLAGMVASHPEDEERMEEGLRLFENLFAYFQEHKEEQHSAAVGEHRHRQRRGSPGRDVNL